MFLVSQVYQRQLSKEGLQSVIGAGQVEETASSIEDLRDLFTLQEGTLSDTHDTLECECMSDERTVCIGLKDCVIVFVYLECD